MRLRRALLLALLLALLWVAGRLIWAVCQFWILWLFLMLLAMGQ